MNDENNKVRVTRVLYDLYILISGSDKNIMLQRQFKNKNNRNRKLYNKNTRVHTQTNLYRLNN